jgi:hypothetical protein
MIVCRVMNLGRQVMGCHVPLDNVRLELTPSRFYVLPYHYLEVAEFESVPKGDTISLFICQS